VSVNKRNPRGGTVKVPGKRQSETVKKEGIRIGLRIRHSNQEPFFKSVASGESTSSKGDTSLEGGGRGGNKKKNS